ANLLINALVVRKRDLEDAAKSADPKAYIQKKAFVAGAAPMGEVKPIASAPKTTSESYTLQGFNIYRDEVKLNEELLKTFSFEDHGLEFGGEYMYQVSAVYADQEVMSEEVWLSNVANGAAEAVCPIAVQPNPVQDVLHIDGEYTTLSLIDMTGRVVLSDVRNAKNISMTNFKTGLYFVRIVLTNGEEYITKIVKQ
ncbi:MAG: T9SS type A sorting domain-containing protein, partial [Lentimicrobiaceae bacterium]|nr:T9SS type A sorting domain-containing protein [Lentimicrobiaceae bacterium]